MRQIMIIALCLICAGTAWSQIGPFEISDRDGTNRIRLEFAGQMRTQYESRDAGSGKDRVEKLYSEARRIRLTLSGKFIEHHLGFKLHLSFAPGSIEMMDAYFNYKFRPQVQLRIGQYKVPFTRYRIQSFQRLTFADWAIVTRYFGAERQIGFAIHSGYEKPPRWGYAVGVFTGVSARASHTIGLAGIYGEEVTNLSDLADPGPRAEYHPEIFVHTSLNSGDISVRSDTDERREGARFSAALSTAWDIDPVEYHDLYIRMAPEVLMKYRGASFSGIGYAGFVRMGTSKIVRLGMSGGLIQSAYRINDRFEFSARYAVVDFEKELIDYAYNRAQSIIGADQTQLNNDPEQELTAQNLEDIKAQYEDAGQTRREKEATMGFNIYWAEHSLKWQNDAGLLIHTRKDGTRKDFVARSQFQLAF